MRTRAIKPIQTAKNVENVLSSTVEDQQPLSPMARMFHEPDSNVYIIIIIGFQTKINPEVMRANLGNTLLKHPRFCSLQASSVPDEKYGGQLKWVRTEVDLDNHVKFPTIDPNMDFPDMYVEDYVSNLSTTKISMSIPMWDLHLLNIKTSNAESVGILRVHHSIGDGTSLMSLFMSFTRKASDPEALPTLPISKKQKPCSSSGGLLQHFIKLFSVLLIYWNTLVDVVMFLITIFFLDDTKTPLKGPSGVGSTPRRIVHRTVSLEDVKLVKNAMNATINDVMVGVTQAALSRYLNRKYGKNKKDGGVAEGNCNLPKNIRLRATSFVNLRPYLGNEGVAEKTKSSSNVRLGNLIGYVLFPFTIALREDALDYVRSAKATGKRKKASLEALCTYFMARTFLKLFGTKLASFPTQTTLWFSNVAGPSEEITLYGHQVAYIAPTCFGQPNALMIHVVSYANKMNIILSVDEGIVPDPHQLCDDLEESLKLIKHAVIYKGLVDFRVY
ncbi:O-acyltransferase WSD1-like isoform X1 [Populus alba x Populus x berolinensis]|uniref:O-acyltransferase WSD1-like isoform X1 n=2 Tax=Populus TaxID=3689 RepID=A0A4U5QZD9_POPAL|nr:O-acyltransferase WSD1-like isoform X1 [Populus alba x Populus x berolinensis]TKS16660.1 O-acyltransferase WSD1-like isoform X1 [Populus alba]